MSDTVILKGTIKNGANSNNTVRVSDDGALVVNSRYAELAARGKVFHLSRAAVTLPVNAATLVSLFGLYNPPGSGTMLEMIEAEAHYVVATTVVGALGLYYSSGTNASGATFTTQVNTIEGGRLGEGAASVCRAYSAVTHVGTPVLADLIGGWGAVTDGGSTPIRKQWNGSIQVPPGVLLAVAMTTAAATTSGFTGLLRWAEVPYVAQ
jgi:hypothetical protein